MTRRTNARVAGFTFLVYIVAGISSLALNGRAHATDVLSVVTSFSALVLGVTLYAITREQDRDLAMLALTCRVIEAMPGEGAPCQPTQVNVIEGERTCGNWSSSITRRWMGTLQTQMAT